MPGIACGELVDSSWPASWKHSGVVPLPPWVPEGPGPPTLFRISRPFYVPLWQESRCKYWATCSSIRLFASTAHSCACSALLVGKWMILTVFFLFWTTVRPPQTSFPSFPSFPPQMPILAVSRHPEPLNSNHTPPLSSTPQLPTLDALVANIDVINRWALQRPDTSFFTPPFTS